MPPGRGVGIAGPPQDRRRVPAPDRVRQIPVNTLGWVVTAGATVWLVVEAVANGVTRARDRHRQDESRQSPPIILERLVVSAAPRPLRGT